jgi:hypothetical protein
MTGPDEEAVRRVARAKATGFENCGRGTARPGPNSGRGASSSMARRPHQALIDAAFFYLNASTHAASPSATSIFGLATWHDYHYYYGHVMWDVDAFCVPPLLFSQPDAALAMLEFRKRGLEAARSNARLSGREGLQFPWEAAPSVGSGSRAGGRRQRRA